MGDGRRGKHRVHRVADAEMLAVAGMPPSDDPAHKGLTDGAPVGALGLEFETRRRNRINGEIRCASGNAGFFIEVVQSFGNCPKYIQTRRPIASGTMGGVAHSCPSHRTSTLSEDAALIANADTFFIASRSAAPGLARSEGLDISHRGGRPGFVHSEGGRQLTFPDYRGNFFFNTLGNLAVEPRCGLLFIDFATGTTVQIAGRGRMLLVPQAIAVWPGAERAVAIEIDAVARTEQRLRERFAFLIYAPQFDRLAANTVRDAAAAAGKTAEP